MKAYGLATHIWNNNWKSLLLLGGFPVLLILLIYALFLLYAGMALAGGVGDPSMLNPLRWAGERLAVSWPYALVGAGLWFAIAYAFYQGMIDASTGAKPLERRDAPELYNLLENLCISRGEPMPALRVMNTPALNAFATGLHQGQYSITVTRGLVDTLNKDELEAVLAHELTHIRNRDVRLLIISVIFVGIFSFVGEMAFRALRSGVSFGDGRSRSSYNRSSGGGSSGGAAGAAIVAIAVGLLIIALSYALAVVIRFALSRKREFLADAGAVELTKNPDAMVSALRKISGHAHVEGPPAEVREMFIENPHADFVGLFATHPPIEKRIAVLEAYAGARTEMEMVGRETPSSGDAGPWH
ncbi:MAG: M48 family metallopeptidase [Caulobacterales bacterium]|jgi:heat shock protein HtpX